MCNGNVVMIHIRHFIYFIRCCKRLSSITFIRRTFLPVNIFCKTIDLINYFILYLHFRKYCHEHNITSDPNVVIT